MASLETPKRISALDAVNLMLANIGEAPVTILGPTAKPSAKDAETKLAEESINIQSQAYNSFREVKLTLDPDTSTGEIALPDNILSWSPVDRNLLDLLTESDGKLYNTEKSTFVFTEPVYVEAVLARPFETLSQPARWFIACSAAIAFANTKQPGGQYLRVTAETLNQAKRAFEAADRRLRKGGLRVHNPHFRRLRGNR